MAFLPYKTEDGHVLPWEYLPCSAITPKAGMALALSSGQLAIATGTTKPQYVSMASYDAAVSAGTPIPVVKVTPEITFEVPLSASGTSLNVGDSVTLHASNGMQVTATTTSGVFKIEDFPEGAKGSGALVRGRFV